MNEQPEALRLADNLDYLVEIGDYAGTATDAAAELRRLHEVNQKLQQQLGEAVWNYGEKVRVNQELLEALKELVQVSAHLDACQATVEAAHVIVSRAEGRA